MEKKLIESVQIDQIQQKRFKLGHPDIDLKPRQGMIGSTLVKKILLLVL